MKFVKLSIFALALGVFATSCGENKTDEAATTDTTMMMPAEPAPMTVDTMMAAPAAGDTTMMATTPSGDTTMMKK